MAINLNVYSSGNASSKTIAVDFVADWLASSSNGVSNQTKYFFKFTTSARDLDNRAYEVRISESLSDLVLNKTHQRIADSEVAYTDVKTMIIDYVYDYVHGHADDLYGSGVAAKSAMKFS